MAQCRSCKATIDSCTAFTCNTVVAKCIIDGDRIIEVNQVFKNEVTF